MKYLILLLLLTSCMSTVTVNGVQVKSPQRKCRQKDLMIVGAGFIFGFAAGPQIIHSREFHSLQTKFKKP